MKALFYSKTGRVVWRCTKDAKFELENGSKARRKGAVRGVLFDAEGKAIDKAEYR
ncbi:hypothetical protein CLV24_11445 [Pontibacter ummariensis]|uniref:Uncharacterized protein n=1 Tax=Pontibacter ummariensis TaxID=1610492 RepID=A0A239HPB9_9BACT|nr:hypothetical protein [Pontibacter ummariensis]PRY10317.1 hypothetical protein CLV24_11445 [Pontibacter ummariensis]SNS82104.1 hypothetical protein SAMN06296052_11445 [Pontibacter ummariensis]